MANQRSLRKRYRAVLRAAKGKTGLFAALTLGVGIVAFVLSCRWMVAFGVAGGNDVTVYGGAVRIRHGSIYGYEGWVVRKVGLIPNYLAGNARLRWSRFETGWRSKEVAWGLSIPIWQLVLAAETPALAIMGLAALRLKRGMCPACGYNLRGLGDGARCPECGVAP